MEPIALPIIALPFDLPDAQWEQLRAALVPALSAAYAAGVQAERARAMGIAQAILDDFPPHWHPAAQRLLAELVPLPDDG